MEHKMLYHNFLYIGILHWIITFFTDGFIFNSVTVNSFFSFAICKILLLGIILLFWQHIGQIKAGDKNGLYIKNILLKSRGYLLLMLFFVICVWPLNIAWGDMINIFNKTVDFNYAYKYHYITSIFHILSKMLIPCVSAPMLIQGFLYSILIGWTIDKIESVFGKKYTKFGYFLFALLPLLYFMLYPNRMPLFSMAYLWLFEIFLFDYFDVKKEFEKQKIAFVLFLASVVTIWRSESIYMIFFAPLIISLIYTKDQKKRKQLAIISYMLMTLLVVLLSIPQKIGTTKDDVDYSKLQKNALFGYTVTTMIYEGLDLDKNAAILDTIEHTLSLESVKKVIQDYGHHCYREAYVSFLGEYYGYKEVTEEEYTAFIRSCYKLFISNPWIFLKAKCNAFVYTSTNQRPFADNSSSATVKENYRFRNGENLFLTETPNQLLKLAYNSFIAGTDSYLPAFQGDFMKFIKLLFYNLFFPFIIIIFITIYTLLKKKWFILLLCITNLIHFSAVFLGAYAGYFMYYLPLYMVAYFYLLIFIIVRKQNVKMRKLGV